MKKGTFKNKLISIIAAASMLIGTMPVFASSSYTISLTTLPGYFSKDNLGGYTAAYSFHPAGDKFLAMQMTKAQVEAEVKPYIEYTLNIEKSGVYTINFKSSPLVNPPYTSPATVSLNGQAVDDFVQVESIDVNTKVYSKTLNLTAGENYLRFTVTGPRGNNANEGLFHLHNITVAQKENKTITENDTLILEAQNYDTYTHALTELKSDSTTAAYGGSFYYPGGVKKSQVSYTYSLFADEAGKYDMTVFASDYQPGWLGQFEVLVNGTVVGDMRDGTGTFCTYKRPVAEWDKTWYIREHYPIEVNLNKGVNNVIIRSYAGGSGNDNYSFAFDCIKFNRASMYKFEGEDGTGGTIVNNTDTIGFSRNAMISTSYNSTTFYAPAGEYDLYIDIGASIDSTQLFNGKYLGAGAFSFDGGTEVAMDGTTMQLIKRLGTSGLLSNCGSWKYKTSINFAEDGEHTFVVKCTGKGEAGNNNGFLYFDCFELVPVNAEIGNAVINVADTVLAKGERTTATSKISYANGYKVIDGIIDPPAYSSSDNSVIVVNNNGEILAKNPGVATVTVTYTVGEETYTASENITVYGEDKIIPISVSYNATTKKATVKLSTVSDDATSAAVILGGYELGADGKISKFTDIFSANKEIARGRVSTIEHVIDGDNIRAFIWNSLEGMKPIRDDIKVK